MGLEPPGGGRPFLARRLEDPDLRARVEAAERLGISKKRLEGWEPTEVTEYEYDDSGRLIRSVTTREVEWDDEEQGWMLALARYRETRCPICGGDLEECGPSSAGKWTAPPPRRCYRMDTLLIKQDGSKHSRPGALMWRAERR